MIFDGAAFDPSAWDRMLTDPLARAEVVDMLARFFLAQDKPVHVALLASAADVVLRNGHDGTPVTGDPAIDRWAHEMFPYLLARLRARSRPRVEAVLDACRLALRVMHCDVSFQVVA